MTKDQLFAVAETPLQKAVAEWACADMPNSEPESRFMDLVYGGCSAGTVGHLIYYCDTVPFYAEHQEEIWNMVCEAAGEMGVSPFKYLADCNHGDPGDYDQVANFLAWYGFEEAAWTLVNRLELDL